MRFREWGPRLRLLLKLHGERRVALDEREPRREVQAPALRLRVLARLGVRQRALQHLRDARGLHATRAAGAPPPPDFAGLVVARGRTALASAKSPASRRRSA